MSEQYEPGTVAVATVRGVPNVRVMRTDTAWVSQDCYHYKTADLADVRPLVVLDPEDHKQVAQLLNKLQDMSYSAHACGAFSCLAEALRSLARPPKPPEPTGDGAVVEDRMGHRWVRIAGPEPDRESKPWRHRGHTARTWEHVNAVRVLSEGVRDV